MPAPLKTSYGSPNGVAAYARLYTTNGQFLDPTSDNGSSTNPTLTVVVSWIDQVSAIVNSALSQNGLVVPIVAVSVIPFCTAVVEQAVNDLCQLANGAGRLAVTNQKGISPWRIIRDEIYTWATQYADGFEKMGAQRVQAFKERIVTRGNDESGDPTFPLFQRKGFGNTDIDWDNPDTINPVRNS